MEEPTRVHGTACGRHAGRISKMALIPVFLVFFGTAGADAGGDAGGSWRREPIQSEVPACRSIAGLVIHQQNCRAPGNSSVNTARPPVATGNLLANPIN